MRWYFTPIASNWGTIDDTVTLTFWVTGFVFVVVNLFMAYCVWRYRHRKGIKAHYEPESKKLEGALILGTAVGVIAMFSRSALGANTVDMLEAVADAIAHGIDRKRAEDALRSTQMALARVARFTTMAALSASIAHEVTQPLSAIITNGDACLRLLASDEPNLGETRIALASIIRDGRRAVDVVNSYLQSRPDPGGETLARAFLRRAQRQG